MNDDCSTPDGAGESWTRRFESALWLNTVQRSSDSVASLRKLVEDDEKRAMCLLWIAEVDPFLSLKYCLSRKSASELLRLAKQIIGVLYGGHTDRQYEPNRLLMRAFLLKARAHFALGEYRECIEALAQATACMTPDDTEAIRTVTDMFWDAAREQDRETVESDQRQIQWNCPKRHEGPYECARDEQCPRPTADDRDRWLRSYWSCPANHVPDECRYNCFGDHGVDTAYAWAELRPIWDIIESH
jgi:tetratricopeptide (TPR) repeat protein